MSALRLAALAAALLASPLMGQETTQRPESRVMVYGPSPMPSCGTWTAERRTRTDYGRGLEYWVLGVVTGFNLFSPDSANGGADRSSDPQGMLAWVDQYCSEHPLDYLTTATLALTDELTRRDRAARR